MNDGMELDPTVLIAVQNERIAAASIREAQLTAAVQQLTMEVMRLKEQIQPVMHEGKAVVAVEDENASPNSGS